MADDRATRTIVQLIDLPPALEERVRASLRDGAFDPVSRARADRLDDALPLVVDADAAPARTIELAERGFGVIAIVDRLAATETWRLLAAGTRAIVPLPVLDWALPGALEAHRRDLALVPQGLLAGRFRPALSKREKQVLGLVVMDMTNAEIAQKLYVAESTVKSHLGSAFQKLGVRSRNEAVALILDPEQRLGTGILRITDEPEPRERAG